jgi:hypothetical protein
MHFFWKEVEVNVAEKKYNTDDSITDKIFVDKSS